MPDIKLFSFAESVRELGASTMALERDLQSLIEKNMQAFFGVTFLQSEFVTSDGRIDSLGLDENFCPVIFEYKRSSNENVINQGLFYLNWLLDHKATFEILVMKTLGKEYSDKLDWSMPRLICIANNFTRYDEHAVKQINRYIDLVRYIKFDKDLLLFELLHSNTAKQVKAVSAAPDGKPTVLEAAAPGVKKSGDKTFDEQVASTTPELRELYYSIRDYIVSLGDDITENVLKLYVAFKKIKNVACIEVRQKSITVYLRLVPKDELLEEGFSRDVADIGHWGTGDLELTIKNQADFEKAKMLILKAYEQN